MAGSTPASAIIRSTRRTVKSAIKELEAPKEPTIKPKLPKKGSIKSAVKDVVKAIRRHRLNYDTFRNVCHSARKQTGLKNPKHPPPLPRLITDNQLKSYFTAVSESGNLQHEIMLKLLFYTGVRNAELTNIRVEDIDLKECKIFIQYGKGAKDRYVLFADGFRSLLRAYLATVPDHEYLFESSQNKPYSTRRIHQIASGYGKKLKPPLHVHPHQFRHSAITWLKRQGIDDAKVQLVSGHANRKTLEKYTHMALTDVSREYQDAMRKVEMP